MTSNLSSTETVARWSGFDALLVWLISGIGVIAAIAMVVAPKFLMPAEDAVMLFLYSRNLAHTGVISYFAGGVRAEGATDFGWMILLAIGAKVGIDPYVLATLLSAISVFLLGVVLLKIAGVKVTALRLCFLFGLVALMPQVVGGAMGFSILAFACILTFLTYCFLQRNDVAAPAVALALCLFRPDGVVFAVPLLIAGLIIYPGRWRRFALVVGLFIAPGIGYFLWRWHYFGELLPLPFLVKSDAPRIAHFLVLSSLNQASLFCYFAAIILWFVLRGRVGDRRNLAVLLCVVVLPNLFYFAMRLDQNLFHRFFVYLPVGTAILIAMNWDRFRVNPFFLLRLGLVLWAVFLFRIWLTDASFIWPYQHDNRKAIAQDLASLPRGSMLITEAGVLPYYSTWKAYDAWGLNTAQFARHFFQPSDASAIQPDLIMILPHGFVVTGNDSCTPEAGWQTPYKQRIWDNFIRNMVASAPPTEYELYLVPYGNIAYRAKYHLKPWQGGKECWFVRRESPLRKAVEDVLVRHGGMTDEQYRTYNANESRVTESTMPDPRTPPRWGPKKIAMAIGRRLWLVFTKYP